MKSEESAAVSTTQPGSVPTMPDQGANTSTGASVHRVADVGTVAGASGLSGPASAIRGSPQREATVPPTPAASRSAASCTSHAPSSAESAVTPRSSRSGGSASSGHPLTTDAAAGEPSASEMIAPITGSGRLMAASKIRHSRPRAEEA